MWMSPLSSEQAASSVYSDELPGMRDRLSSSLQRTTTMRDIPNTQHEHAHKHFRPATQLDPSRYDFSPTLMRSPSSTRSVIDPSSSPPVASHSPIPIFSWGHAVHVSHMAEQAYIPEPRADSRPRHSSRRTRARRHGPKPRWRPRHSEGRAFLPFMKTAEIRNKVFHCIIGGFVLGITLIVCTYSQQNHLLPFQELPLTDPI